MSIPVSHGGGEHLILLRRQQHLGHVPHHLLLHGAQLLGLARRGVRVEVLLRRLEEDVERVESRHHVHEHVAVEGGAGAEVSRHPAAELRVALQVPAEEDKIWTIAIVFSTIP